jgi:predicted RecA/RadA family phage recombinase
MAYSVNFYQDGKSIDYTPISDVAAGTIVVLNGLVGVTKLDIAAGAKGALCVQGVFAVPKKDEAFKAGLPVWFDANGDPKAGTAGTGAATQIGGDAQAADDVLLGTAVKNAAAADQFVYVAINKFDPRIPTFAGTARITKSPNLQV